jgi:hypothetical protein
MTSLLTVNFPCDDLLGCGGLNGPKRCPRLGGVKIYVLNKMPNDCTDPASGTTTCTVSLWLGGSHTQPNIYIHNRNDEQS